MRKMFKKLNKQKGAITIEATISLTSFLFMFIMVYSIITVCRTQAKIQVAINSTAKELSQYSYVYAITGLEESTDQLEDGSSETRGQVNDLAGNIANVFGSMQSIGGEAAEMSQDVQGLKDISDLKSKWQSIEGNLSEASQNFTEAQQTITEMAKDPKAVLLGMGKIFASEGYDLAKTAAAEALARVMTERHLKRDENDTADRFCKSVGIVPGTYLFKESYFNGIDFSHSKMFPGKSNDIIIVANYKMKLLQLLPIDFEFHFTQTAHTLGWMHGDKSGGSSATPSKKLDDFENNKKKGESVWNTMDGSERETMIRRMGISDMCDGGDYVRVSGETYFHAYSSKDNTLALVRSYNPLQYAESADKLDKAQIKSYLEKLQGQMLSNTDNRVTVKVKNQAADGSVTVDEINCIGVKTKATIVVPQDEEVKKLFDEVLAEMNPKVTFEILPGYGYVYETEKNPAGSASGGA